MRISDWSSDVCSSDLIIRSGRRLRDCGATLARLRERAAAFAGLPAGMPELSDTSGASSLVGKIDVLRGRKTTLAGDSARLDAEMDACTAGLDALLEEPGGECPTCGTGGRHAEHLVHARAALNRNRVREGKGVSCRVSVGDW